MRERENISETKLLETVSRSGCEVDWHEYTDVVWEGRQTHLDLIDEWTLGGVGCVLLMY